MSSRPTCSVRASRRSPRRRARPHGLSTRLRHRPSAVHAHRRHLRKGARCRDRLAQPALRHGLPQGRRALLRAGPAAAGRGDHPAIPRGRRSPHHSRLRRPLRGARPADRALRRRGAAAAGGTARRLPGETMRLGMLLRYSGAPDLGAGRGAGGRAPRLRLGVERRGLRHRRGDADRLDPRPHDADQGRHRHHADAGAHAGLHGDDRDDAAGAVGRPLPAWGSAPPGRRSSKAGTACRSASRWRAPANTSRSSARS